MVFHDYTDSSKFLRMKVTSNVRRNYATALNLSHKALMSSKLVCYRLLLAEFCILIVVMGLLLLV